MIFILNGVIGLKISPLLFNVLLDKLGEQNIRVFRYADDIAIVGNGPSQQEKLAG